MHWSTSEGYDASIACARQASVIIKCWHVWCGMNTILSWLKMGFLDWYFLGFVGGFGIFHMDAPGIGTCAGFDFLVLRFGIVRLDQLL